MSAKSSDNRAERESRWPSIIADAIEINLLRLRQGGPSEVDFANDMASIDPLLYDPKNVKDGRLSAAWNFADSYFDAVRHGLEELDGIALANADGMLRDVVRRLRSGDEITDAQILRYA